MSQINTKLISEAELKQINNTVKEQIIDKIIELEESLTEETKTKEIIENIYNNEIAKRVKQKLNESKEYSDQAVEHFSAELEKLRNKIE